MALEFGFGRMPGYARRPRDPAQQQQQVSNAQPQVRQANQRGQAPFFQPSAPRGAEGPQGPAAPAPGPQSLTTRAIMQPGYAPSSWGTPAPRTQRIGGMVGGGFQAPPPQPLQDATGTPQVGTQPYQSSLSKMAQQLVERLASSARPDTAALKESQKESLNQLRADALTGERSSAARRGVAGGGNLGGREAGINDEFAGLLTGSYRDIDQEAQQQEFTNLLNASGLSGQLGGAEEQRRLAEELGRAGINLDWSRIGLGRDQLNQQGSQFNRSMSLQEALANAAQDDDFLRMLMELLG